MFRAFHVSVAWAALPLASSQDIVLPDVDEMMSEAADTLHDFTKRTEQVPVQERVTEHQREAQEALEQDRSKYEGQLHLLQENITAETARNKRVKDEIQALRTGNKIIFTSADATNQRNVLMRNALSLLVPKLENAKDFLDKSVSFADLKDHTVLNVLKAQPNTTLENFLAVTRGNINKVSLLGTSSWSRRDKVDQSKDIIKDLAARIESVKQADVASANQLQARFLATSESHAKQIEALMAEQAELNNTHRSLETLQSDLWVAKARVEDNSEALVQRLEGLKTFMNKAKQAGRKSVQQAEQLVQGMELPEQSPGPDRSDVDSWSLFEASSPLRLEM